MFVQFGVRLLGVVYTALGIIGFFRIDTINPFHHEGIGARYLLNLVAINDLHNIIHLAIGLTGLWAAGNLPRSRSWCRIAGTVLLLLFAAGMVQAIIEGLPVDQLFLGLIPLNSPGHFLHLVTGGIALYMGFAPARLQAGSS